MDSDDSQSASSGNESEVDESIGTQHSSRRSRSSSHDSEKSSKSSKSAKSSISGKSSVKSRSRSNSSENRSASSDSNSRSPTADRPTSPKSSDSEDETFDDNERLPPASPDNVSLDRPMSVLSASSSVSPLRKNSIGNDKSPLSARNDNEDSQSAKSGSSRASRKSRISTDSDSSTRSKRSRNGRKAANLDDGITSDSSVSSINSHTDLKHIDNQAEEISDGDIDLSDNEKIDEDKKEDNKCNERPSNLVHEDLSDVSDLDYDTSEFGAIKETEDNEDNDELEKKSKNAVERNKINDVVEEQLDFEAEDGECAESEILKDKDDNDKPSQLAEAGELADEIKTETKKSPEELEEGELTDEDDVRPEETEPRPVCRFFSRGQCTWGASCRFLHPGVTDKGNYTMFDLVRPVVPGDYGNDRMMYGGSRAEPPQVESAWERGLRTAKEMMRKSIKRKEQDIDFEEKKMNLSLAQEELDKENGYYAKAPSPEPRYVTMRHGPPLEYPAPHVRPPPPEEYYSRRQVIYEPEYTPVPRERYRTYREIPPHRPDYYNKHDEDIIPASKRPKREVIVQRAEERTSRADEWSDPWMRSKSPAGRKRARKHSYSSGSSYSSSSSSRSSSPSSRSSYRSQSRSSRKKRSPRTHRRQVSPSVIVSERKAANERAALMNPPAPRKRAPSPGMMRVGAQNPPAPPKVDQFGRTRSKLAVAAALARVKNRNRSSRSSSGSSSGSSSSDSDSSGSSSSSSRNVSPTPKRSSGVDLALALKAKAMDALKTGSEKKQIKLNLKSNTLPKKTDLSELTRKTEAGQSRKRPLNLSPSPDPKNTPTNKKASTRREELLKQLKAVEDAIAKKRSKVN